MPTAEVPDESNAEDANPDGPTLANVNREKTLRHLLVRDAADHLEDVGHVSEMPKKLVELLTTHRARIHDLFLTLDKSGDSMVSADEFGSVLGELGFEKLVTADFDRLFHAIDKDNSGWITMDELEAMFSAAKRGKDVLDRESARDKRERLAREETERVAREREAAADASRLAAEAESARLQREREAAAEAERLAKEQAEAERRRQREIDRLAASAARRINESHAERMRRETIEYNARLQAALDLLPKPKVAPISVARARPAWNSHTRPRAERGGIKRAMALLATADPRPASVAHPHTAEVYYSQGADYLRADYTLDSQRFSATALNVEARPGLCRLQSAPVIRAAPNPPPSYRTAPMTTSAALVQKSTTAAPRTLGTSSSTGSLSSLQRSTHLNGSKRHPLLVHRVAPHHFIFTSNVLRLDPGPRTILDGDIVETAIAKLHAAFPNELPTTVPWDSSRRPVRLVLVARNSILLESKPIADQYRRSGFYNTFKPNPVLELAGRPGAALHRASSAHASLQQSPPKPDRGDAHVQGKTSATRSMRALSRPSSAPLLPLRLRM